MLTIKIQVKENENTKIVIGGSQSLKNLELDSFTTLIGTAMKLYDQLTGSDRKVARGLLMVALNDTLDEHSMEMNGGM